MSQSRLVIAMTAASAADARPNLGIAITTAASRMPTPPGANNARYPAK